MKKNILFITIIFIFYLILVFLYIKDSEYRKGKDIILKIQNGMLSDLIFKDGFWDTSKYVNDTEVSGEYPYYIITADGFVIGRNEAIHGFLDTANLSYASSFQKPTTIISEANEKWRLFSKFINIKNKQVGVIMVGYYQPEDGANNEIDRQLRNNAEKISSMVKLTGENISAASVEPKNIDIGIAYTIINKNNKVLKEEGEAPAFIDPSYIEGYYTTMDKEIIDKESKEKFLVKLQPLSFGNNTDVGLIINAYPLTGVYAAIFKQFALVSVTSIALLIMTLIFIKKAYKVSYKPSVLIEDEAGIWFDKTNCSMRFKDSSFSIPFPSYQHKICKLLFSKSRRKKWAYDEIAQQALDVRFDEVKAYRHVVYDAIEEINKKSIEAWGFKIVEYQSQFYQITPKSPA